MKITENYNHLIEQEKINEQQNAISETENKVLIKNLENKNENSANSYECQ
jgi:hypothetical protein